MTHLTSPGMFWLGERRAVGGPGIVVKWGVLDSGKRDVLFRSARLRCRLDVHSIEQLTRADKEALRFSTPRLRATMPYGNDGFSTCDVMLCPPKLLICCRQLHRMQGGGVSGYSKPLTEEGMHDNKDAIPLPLSTIRKVSQFTNSSADQSVR